MRDLLHSLEDFPDLRRPNDTALLRLEVSSPTSTSSRDNGYISLRVEDAVSGIVLVDVRLDPARFWRLLQGSIQTWPGFVSPHLDRYGKTMENETVTLPDELDDDTEEDVRRDVRKAVREQLAEDWWDTWEVYDAPRKNNRRQRYTVVRRWTTPPKETP